MLALGLRPALAQGAKFLTLNKFRGLLSQLQDKSMHLKKGISMKNFSMIIVLLLTMNVATFAQQPQATQSQPKVDPLLLTDKEQRELNDALDFVGQAKKEYNLALDDALNAPIERMNALEVVGRLQKANTILKAANQHFTDLRETHRARRSDCEKCEYAPDLTKMAKPTAH